MSGNPFDPFGGGAAAAAPAAPTSTMGGGGYGGDPWAVQPNPPPQQQQPQQQPPPQQAMYGGMPMPQQQQMQQQYQQPPVAQPYPGMQQPPQQQPQPPAPAAAPVPDPWGAPAAQYPPPAAAPAQQPSAMNPYAPTPAYTAPAPSAAPMGAYNPFAAVPDAQQGQPQQQQQLVLSQQQSNPYGGIVAPPTGTNYGGNSVPQQAMVPAGQPGFAWGAPPPQQQQQQQQPYGTAAAASFDPFAVAPPPPPAPAPAPVPDPMMMMMVQHQQQPQSPPQQQQQQQQQQQAENPFGDFLPPAPAPAAPEPPRPAEVSPSHERQLQPYGQGGGGGSAGGRGDDNSRAMVPAPARNPYSQEIARQAAPYGASPLPKAELVKKTGYILSRISFRTIVMKKWKQSFWVQYGSHTMLWFRAEEDFKDWLNNPYHTQAQRNFLIKLAVNFVHDLYKPNVRGYQVTQSRVKPYGNKMVRQFKLERWMDYGPTIAAAFGSYDIKEVEDLRKAIVECMRNTPLENGIRATGAVQQQQQPNQQQLRLQQHPHNGGGGGGDRPGQSDGYGQNDGPSGRRHTMGGTYMADGRCRRHILQEQTMIHLTFFYSPPSSRLFHQYDAHIHAGVTTPGGGSTFGGLGNRLVGRSQSF